MALSRGKGRRATMSGDDGPELEPESKEESIRVCTRVRPLFPKEVDNGHVKAWKVEPTVMRLVVEPPSQFEVENESYGRVGGPKKPIVEKTQAQKDVIQRVFAFDKCFDDEAENDEVFDYVARDLVIDAFKGINGCVFAYGQTGSGKTHSIMGVAEDPGILPRSLAEFFDCMADPTLLEEKLEEANEIESGENGGFSAGSKKEGFEEGENREYLMRVSYVEIYLERVNDLLQEGPKGGAVENLDVKEDPKKGFVVVGLHEEAVASMEEVMTLLSKAEQRRHFARTNFNETSSRSHVVFSITLESTSTFEDGTNISRRGELKIVDLAGNEKAGRASEGVENSKLVLEEGKAINKSLFLLSEVISKLSKQAQQQGDDRKGKKGEKDVYIPWRDSKLTRLLQKSLGGNSRAAVLVAVHPSNLYLDTSFSTLRFAMKCKEIKKKICANFFSPEQSLIAQQKRLIAMLHSQLKELSEGGVNGGLATRNAIENDEQMRILRNDLENKVAKFQQFIIKATAPAAESSAGGLGLLRARTMRGPSTFRRMETMAAARFGLRDIDGMNQTDAEETSMRAPMGHALSLLGRFGSKQDPFMSLPSAASRDSASPVMRFETLEHSIDAAMQELESIDKDTPLSKDGEESDLNSDFSEDGGGEASVTYEGGADAVDLGAGEQEEPQSDGSIEETSIHTDANVPSITLKRTEKLEKKKKKVPKGSKVRRARSPHPSSQVLNTGTASSAVSKDSLLLSAPTATPNHEVETAIDKAREVEEVNRKLNALMNKQKAERSEWAARLRKAKEKGLEIVSKVLYRMQDEKEALARATKRSSELAQQIRYISALMHRLGLSVLSTASFPGSDSSMPSLQRDTNGESLSAYLSRIKKLLDTDFQNISSGLGDKADTPKKYDFSDIDQVRPLAYAVLSNALSRAMLVEAHQPHSVDSDPNQENLLPPLVAAQKVNSGVFLPDPGSNEVASEPEHAILTEAQAVDAIELILTPVSGKTSQVQVQSAGGFKTTEKSKECYLESVLQMLSPWEQHMLALLYEQQEMRRALGQLRDHFAARIKELHLAVKKGMLERLELSEHCERLLAALWGFKAELEASREAGTVEEDTNAKFGKLMAKLEELSVKLAEKDVDYKLLSGEYTSLKEENAVLQARLRKMHDEMQSLILIPMKMVSATEETATEARDVAKTSLARDVCLLQSYATHLRSQLEERRAVELDIRRLNQALYSELLAANSAISDLKSQLRFHSEIGKRDSKSLEEQLAVAIESEAVKSERVRELESEVESLREQVRELQTPPADTVVECAEVQNSDTITGADAKDSDALGTARSRKSFKGVQATPKPKAKAKSKSSVKFGSNSFGMSPGTRALSRGKVGSIKRPAVSFAPQETNASQLVNSKAGSGMESSSPPKVSKSPSSGAIKFTAPEGSRLIKHASAVATPSDASLGRDKAADVTDSLLAAEAVPKPVAKAPAFTGDPRDKGLATMAQNLNRRRKKAA